MDQEERDNTGAEDSSDPETIEIIGARSSSDILNNEAHQESQEVAEGLAQEIEEAETSLSMPLHWSEPATGEVPRVLVDEEALKEVGDDQISDAVVNLSAQEAEVSFRTDASDWDEDFKEVAMSKEDLQSKDVEIAIKKRGFYRITPDRRNRELLTRIVTGAIFAVVFGATLIISPALVLVAICVILVLALSEFYSSLVRAHLYPAGIIGILGALGASITVYLRGVDSLLIVISLVTITTFLWFLPGNNHSKRHLVNVSSTLLGFLWIGVFASFGALIISPRRFPDRHGVAYFAGGLLFAILNDVGAYFFSKLLSRFKLKTHAMATHISPNKTWEGVIGGFILSILGGVFMGSVMYPWKLGDAVLISAVIALANPLGDLSESLIKRDLGLKDMGSLLPGHGGILDRIDGILFALPTLYYMLELLRLH